MIRILAITAVLVVVLSACAAPPTPEKSPVVPAADSMAADTTETGGY